MLYTAFLFLVGLIMICAGGDLLVHAAAAIASRFGISQIVVGATIVSFCTTLPEILVSTTAIFLGSAAISVGNALGSIICNTSLIAGLSLLLRPSADIAYHALLWRSIFFFTVIAGLWGCGLFLGAFYPPAGVILLLLFVLYMVLSIRFSSLEAPKRPSESKSFPVSSPIRLLSVLVICAVLLFVGADLLVDNGMLLAEALGIPQRVIAVTAIALGTSLPELVTTLISLLRRRGDIGLGNVIGANLLNLLLVIGIPAVFRIIPLDASSLYADIPLAILVMLILTVPTLIRRKTSRLQGGVLILLYVLYCLLAL